MGKVSAIITWFILKLIAVYQYTLSPMLSPRCRFVPSCSCYAKEAIIKFGVLKGGYLTLKRLLKCQPFGSSGYDPLVK